MWAVYTRIPSGKLVYRAMVGAVDQADAIAIARRVLPKVQPGDLIVRPLKKKSEDDASQTREPGPTTVEPSPTTWAIYLGSIYCGVVEATDERDAHGKALMLAPHAKPEELVVLPYASMRAWAAS